MRRWLIRLACVLAVMIGAMLFWQWVASEAHVISSRALGSDRTYRVFNPNSHGPVIYALDGQNARHGLLPAVIFSVTAAVKGQELPKIVAIASGKDRDADFRNARSEPELWRPRIAGHANRFDSFLIGEIIPVIEGEAIGQTPRFVMGHSLAGLYALDLGARHPDAFDGIFAFAPTFSHDLSIANRLAQTCRDGVMVYANWGWESARDTATFEKVMARWNAAPECGQQRPITRRHFGAFHQVIMLTGQVDLALRFLE